VIKTEAQTKGGGGDPGGWLGGGEDLSLLGQVAVVGALRGKEQSVAPKKGGGSRARRSKREKAKGIMRVCAGSAKEGKGCQGKAGCGMGLYNQETKVLKKEKVTE